MLIELWDMDVPYAVQTDCSVEGRDFIRISPNYDPKGDRNSDGDICLDYDQCQELIRVLQFVSQEISD